MCGCACEEGECGCACEGGVGVLVRDVHFFFFAFKM